MTSGAPGRGSRFTDAFPRPVFVVFAVFAVAAAVLVVLLVLRRAAEPVGLAERRPPPVGSLSHDVVRIVSAPLPRVLATAPPACPALARVRIIGGGDAVSRLRSALEHVCRFARGGVTAEMREAIAGLEGGAVLRFGIFRRSGVDSTTERGFPPTVWLNARFAISSTPPETLVPLVLHEAWHLARAAAVVSARQELAARRVELEACRLAIAVERWPRFCDEARALAGMPEARALDLLVAAGYARG